MDFLCYTLEDERRKDKIMSETRVPAGVYSIKLRDEGGMTKRYAAKYKDMHKGMLCIHNAPDWKINVLKKDGFIGKSVQAYKRIYPLIVKALDAGEEVTIEYIDLD